MENLVVSPKCKLIVEHTVSDGGTPTLVCRGRITGETASLFRSEIKTLAPKHKFLMADLAESFPLTAKVLGAFWARIFSPDPTDAN